MSQPDASNKEPSKLSRLTSSQPNQSVQGRLPRGNNTPPPVVNSETASPERRSFFSRIAPTFWTIASVISLSVNLGLVIVLLVVLKMLGGTQAALTLAQDQASGILGGLYTNFIKMDAASIKTTIHVEKEIPVQFTLSVSGPTDVTLTRDVSITGALVTVNTGGLNINNARANIVLPAGTLLPVQIQNLLVPVDQKVLAVLDVPVDIPLNHTELHEPFVGLQKVVEPFYCFLQPDTIVNGINVCAGAQTILPMPTPSGTLIP